MNSLPIELFYIIFSYCSNKDIKLLSNTNSCIYDIITDYYHMILPNMYNFFCNIIKTNIKNKNYLLKDCNIIYDNIDKTIVDKNLINITKINLKDGIYYHSHNTWISNNSSLSITQYINNIFYIYNSYYIIMINKNKIQVCNYTNTINNDFGENYYDKINLKPNSKVFKIF